MLEWHVSSGTGICSQPCAESQSIYDNRRVNRPAAVRGNSAARKKKEKRKDRTRSRVLSRITFGWLALELTNVAENNSLLYSGRVKSRVCKACDFVNHDTAILQVVLCVRACGVYVNAACSKRSIYEQNFESLVTVSKMTSWAKSGVG